MTANGLLDLVERDGKGPLNERAGVELLVQRAIDGMDRAFLDACFHAKFLVRSQEVMRRIGRGSQGFDALAAEFQSGVERTMTIVRELAEKAPEPGRAEFMASFLRPEGNAFERFLALCADLARVKNHELDGRPLPFGPATAPTAGVRASNEPGLQEVVRVARVAFFLLMLLLILDGPSSILGWIIAFIIVGTFIMIEFTVARVRGEKGS